MVNIFVLGYLLAPAVSPLLAVSARLAAAGRDVMPRACDAPELASAGDHEPSLVFLTATDLALTTGDGAAAFLKGRDCRAAFVESRAEPAFRAALGDSPEVRLATRVAGTAINGGKHLDIGIYVRQRKGP